MLEDFRANILEDKFYMLLATLQLNCMKIRLEVLTTATTILLAHTRQFLQDLLNILILMRSIYSYIFCLEILLLLYNLHIFASDQINEESNDKKMFFSNF